MLLAIHYLFRSQFTYCLTNLNLQLIIYLGVYTIDIKVTIKRGFYKNEFEIDHENNPKFEIADNKLLSPCPYSAKQYISEDIISMIKFNTMRSSLRAKPVFTITNQRFLTSITNRERGSTQDIYTRIFEVDRICCLINEHFGLKARP